MRDADTGEPSDDEAVHALPVQAVALAAAPERPIPVPYAAGKPIAVIGHTGDAALLGHGHIEIGFSDQSGDPLSHHGLEAWTPAGYAMRQFLIALSAAYNIHNA